MKRSTCGHCLAWLGLMAPLTANSEAASLPSTYSVTDLGLVTSDLHYGTAPTGYSAIPAGNAQTITAQDGRLYAFPRTSPAATPVDLSSVPAPLPKLNDPYAFSGVDPSGRVVTNANGMTIGAAQSGIGGHDAYLTTGVFATQREADGSFGPPRVLWTSKDLSNPAQAIAINIENEVLGLSTNSDGAQYRRWLTADAISGAIKTIPIAIDGWYFESLDALDDQGRILATSQSYGRDGQHALLLTPEGVSSEPLATPEPATLLILGVGAAGFWWRRAVRAAGSSRSGVSPNEGGG